MLTHHIDTLRTVVTTSTKMTGQKQHGDEIKVFSAEQIYYDVTGREHSTQEIDYKCVNIFGCSS
jgi:hypothetical protein